MTIVYCDYLAGNDTSGDGSASNPYKTITTASLYATGYGNEVRAAKSPAHTVLSGTVTFTNNSDTAATSEDISGSIAASP